MEGKEQINVKNEASALLAQPAEEGTEELVIALGDFACNPANPTAERAACIKRMDQILGFAQEYGTDDQTVAEFEAALRGVDPAMIGSFFEPGEVR